jgi:hypothetical protein
MFLFSKMIVWKADAHLTPCTPCKYRQFGTTSAVLRQFFRFGGHFASNPCTARKGFASAVTSAVELN